jgi:hypothetical protein
MSEYKSYLLIGLDYLSDVVTFVYPGSFILHERIALNCHYILPLYVFTSIGLSTYLLIDIQVRA